MEEVKSSIPPMWFSNSYEDIIEMEANRQKHNVELIASENFPSERVLKAAGSILTNKYAEGYPGKRYYGGCEYIDMIERKAIYDACTLFKCNYANVQPHCGSSANQAVYRAFCKPGDRVIGMDLGAGGHLTHGHKMSFSGQDYEIFSYGVDENGIINYDELRDLVFRINPKMIIVGASSYSQIIDYERIGKILEEYYNDFEVKIIYMVDMAHVAGLIAAGVHPSPFPWADVVTSTTHKTLRGPRGGLILWNNEEYTNKINSAVFPGIQGGPLEHIIAAKGICFEEASTDEFKEYGKQIIKNASSFANKFKELGYKIISNGTQNHMFVLDVYNTLQLTGKEAEYELDKIGITLNKNQIPNDTLPPLKSSGVRIGVPAMTTKGWKEKDFEDLAIVMDEFLKKIKYAIEHDNLVVDYSSSKEKVEEIVNRYL